MPDTEQQGTGTTTTRNWTQEHTKGMAILAKYPDLTQKMQGKHSTLRA